ncbi:cardiolipin synthase [Clostridium carnis]
MKINLFLLIILFLIIFNLLLILPIILIERKRPEKTLAWILILIFIPPIGLVLYIFLGRNWKINTLDKKMQNKLKDLIYPIVSKDYKSLNEYTQLIDLLAVNSYSPIFCNNKITILDGGNEKFKYLKEELLKAKHHIHLEYYIVKNDTIGNEIKDILIKKASEGVNIKFIIDRVGSFKLKRSYISELKKAGIDVVFYSYIFAPLLRCINTQINYRNHRKIVIIDGSIGFIGGINIGDEYLGLGNLGNWRDCHLMVKGDFVLGLQSIFLDDYSSIKKCNNEDILINNNISNYFLQDNHYGNTFMQLIKSGPDSEYPSIMQSMVKMISMAKKEIKIITPYFIPTEALIDSLRIAALSGIDITIVFPEKADHIAVNRASRTYLSELVRCGAKVYLYSSDGFIHSKILTIDKSVTNIGTANMDIRSFELNYEVNAIIYDSKITEYFNRIIANDLKKCKVFSIEEYDNEGIIDKVLNGLSRLLSSIL